LCNGQSQTPIDFSSVIINNALDIPTFNTEGGCESWAQLSTNYTFEAALAEPGRTLCDSLSVDYSGSTYTLKQIHFHSPSEHTIGGGYFDAEVHLVHINSASQLAVFGIFLQVANSGLTPANNTFLQNLWNYGAGATLNGAEIEIDNAATTFDPYTDLLPARRSFYTYNGSLTTPPCSQNVKWTVFDQPVTISPSDLSILRKAAKALKTNWVSENGNDNRFPTQPLNGRTVQYSAGETIVYVADDDNNDDDHHHVNRSLSISAIVFSIVALLLSSFLAYNQFTMRADLKKLLAASAAGNGGEIAMKIQNPINAI
jgi:carbonic anhydrase